MTWTAPEIDRRQPPNVAGERAALQGWLQYERDTLLTKCAGLTHEQLATRSVPPSTMSLLGIVRHMADVERWWFRTNVTGESLQGFFGPEGNLEGDFDDLDSMPAEQVLEVYAAECAAADAAVAGLPLEHTFSHHRRAELDLRWVYVHMIEEYARHNGHADLLRELVDGATGE